MGLLSFGNYSTKTCQIGRAGVQPSGALVLVLIQLRVAEMEKIKGAQSAPSGSSISHFLFARLQMTVFWQLEVKLKMKLDEKNNTGNESGVGLFTFRKSTAALLLNAPS